MFYSSNITQTQILVQNSFLQENGLNSEVFIVVLGTIQDAGSPQINCKKECCKDLFIHPDESRKVTSLGLIDNQNTKKFLFEASPDIATQMKSLVSEDIRNKNEMVDGIFVSHAHIGHYTGLMYLGKEACDANRISVYTMPRMTKYLKSNGPWSQLIKRNNITLTPIRNEQVIELSSNLRITPFLVPHRDEYSETVGYKIKGPNKTALFIPDIDKWHKWNKNIVEEIKNVDYAFLDGTFYDAQEINYRDISEIPHPFIVESLELFKNLSTSDKNKIIFIHFNHTNPVLNLNSPESKFILDHGFKIARLNEKFLL